MIDKEKIRLKSNEWRRANKLLVLKHYSNNELACNCCGESIYEFLTIDHINGGGNKHRIGMVSGRAGSGDFYRFLIKNNFPDGYQVLCFNCNNAKHMFKRCPHKEVNLLELL